MMSDSVVSVDSVRLKESIVSMYKTVELTDWSHDVTEIQAGSLYGNELKGDLVIRNYPHLRMLSVVNVSFMDVRSVTICDNPVLEEICIASNSFQHVTRSLTLSSKLHRW